MDFGLEAAHDRAQGVLLAQEDLLAPLELLQEVLRLLHVEAFHGKFLCLQDAGVAEALLDQVRHGQQEEVRCWGQTGLCQH